MKSERRSFGIAPIIITLFVALRVPIQAPTAIQLFLPGGAEAIGEWEWEMGREE